MDAKLKEYQELRKKTLGVKFHTRACSICGYQMPIKMEKDQPLVNTGCNCVNYDKWEPIGLEYVIKLMKNHLESSK